MNVLECNKGRAALRGPFGHYRLSGASLSEVAAPVRRPGGVHGCGDLGNGFWWDISGPCPGPFDELVCPGVISRLLVNTAISVVAVHGAEPSPRAPARGGAQTPYRARMRRAAAERISVPRPSGASTTDPVGPRRSSRRSNHCGDETGRRTRTIPSENS